MITFGLNQIAHIMKKWIVLFKAIVLSVISFSLQGQILPSATVTASPSSAWSRVGNSAGLGYNLLGTRNWNSPVYFHTYRAFATPWGTTGANRQLGIRMKLNGWYSAANQYPVNSYTRANGVYTEGYLGLGWNKEGLWSRDNQPGVTRGPFSLLHLNGYAGDFVQSGGYRPWMKTGISFTDNEDFSYIGLRRFGIADIPANLSTATDITETVIAWSDNGGTGFGPDELAFRFTAGGGSTSTSSNRNLPTDLDGKMIAQFRANGNVGFGAFFQPGVTTAKPQSRLHLAKINGTHALNPQPNQVWAQLTNSSQTGGAINTGASTAQRTGHTSTDGLRMGIIGRTGYIRHQERYPLIIQTDWDDVSGSSFGERIRISSINAPGVPFPTGINPNATRVAVSYNGGIPLDDPRSLLHLGFGISDVSGIRPWMDLGTSTVGFGTMMYYGMRGNGSNPNPLPVMAWGDFTNAGMPVVYTSDASGNGAALNGLEVARFSSAASTYGGNGALGVGDFSSGLPTHKLHVRGNGRFENVPDNNNAEYLILGNQVGAPDDVELQKLAFTGDPTDVLLGDGTWGPGGSGTDDQQIDSFYFDCTSNILTFELEDGGTATADFSCLTGGGSSIAADNGLSIATTDPNRVQLGQTVTTTAFSGAAELLDNREVPLNGRNIVFSGLGSTSSNSFAIGDFAGSNATNSLAKLYVKSDAKYYGQFMEMSDAGNPYGVMVGEHIDMDMGVVGTAKGQVVDLRTTGTFGVNFATGYEAYVENPGIQNRGMRLDVIHPTGTAGSTNTGGFANVSGAANNTGFQVLHTGAQSLNRSFYGQVIGAAQRNQGASLLTQNGTVNNEAVVGIAYADGTSINRGVTGTLRAATTGSAASAGFGGAAGYFNVNVDGGNPNTTYAVYGTVSGGDANDWAGFFNGDGFITTPWTVSDQKFKKNIENIEKASDILDQLNPKTYTFKDAEYPTVNLPESKQYGLIAQDLEKVMPELVKEAQIPAKLDSAGNILHEAVGFKSVSYNGLIPVLIQGHKEQQAYIKTLEDRLEKLEGVLNSTRGESGRGVSNHTQTVKLEDPQTIILDQNVPNPFAENTVITYMIPESVNNAQIFFYDQAGRVINTVDIIERGEGSLKVFGEDLSNGIYTYSLVVDGKVMDSKKMVKTK